MTDTAIEWTDKTWNPVTGCTKVSPGCAHCYAEAVADRFWGRQYPPVLSEGCAIKTRPRVFTDVQVHEDRLEQPLRWKKPARVFVNSMSDLFHEDVPDQFIDRVFAVMALAPRHTFQVLTKRADRMYAYFRSVGLVSRGGVVKGRAWEMLGHPPLHKYEHEGILSRPWPLPNVWLGVSVENQHFADQRIPLLLNTPATVRFISAEPLLGAISFRWAKWDNWSDGLGHRRAVVNEYDGLRMLDWVIVGGESGPSARPFCVAWARSIVAQCKAVGVAVFVKQFGADVRDRNDAGFTGDGEPTSWPDMDPDDIEEDLDGTRDGYQGAPVRVHLKSRKGGDMAEWPEDLRVREFPR